MIKATLTLDASPGGIIGTIFDGVETRGYLITPFLPGTTRRVILIVSRTDYEEVSNMGPRSVVTVKDLATSNKHRLVRTSCGAGCYCAVTFDANWENLR